MNLSETPSISGATVTLTLATAVMNTDTDVKVSYTKPISGSNNTLVDGFDNELANFTDQAVTNNTPIPVATLSSSRVNGTRLVMTFTRSLANEPLQQNSAFTVKKTSGGIEETVTLSVRPRFSANGRNVILTLATAAVYTDTDVKVSYTRPTDGLHNKLVDKANSELVASFTDQPVTNNSPAPAPTLSGATVNGTSLVMTFTRNLAAAPSLENSAFTVKKTPSGMNEETVGLSSSPSIIGATVTLTLATAVVSTDTDVKVSYTKPASGSDNSLVGGADNEVANFTDHAVTNTTPISTDASLGGLTVSPGSLSPGFASGTTTYTVSVANTAARITLTATQSHPGAGVQFQTGYDAELSDVSGTDAGFQVDLAVGSNPLLVKVTAEDNSTTRTYEVNVTRADATRVNPGVQDVAADWALIPSGLAGREFRLIFITSTQRNAVSTDIADYNTFVQSRAAAGHSAIQSYSAGFRVLGGTPTVAARDNTYTTGSGVPVYWLDGDKAADNYGDLYDGSWDSVSARNESGNTDTIVEVWDGEQAGRQFGFHQGARRRCRYRARESIQPGGLPDRSSW